MQDYRNTVRAYLLPAFGAQTPLSRITTEAIDAYRERLLSEGRLSRRSIQKVLVLLYGILKRAKRKKWITTNPAEDAVRGTVKRSGDFNVLSPVEVEAVARAAVDEHEAALFTLAAFAGLRMGELRALRWTDVDFERRVVFVRRNFIQTRETVPKSGRIRSVPLIDQAAAALDRLSRRQRFTGADDLVFCNALGRHLDDGEIRTSFYVALERSGLGHLRRKQDPLVFHDLRHTFGTLAVRVFPLSDVQAFMGHERIDTTMIYVHHVPQHDAAEQLSAMLRAEATAAPLTETSQR